MIILVMVDVTYDAVTSVMLPNGHLSYFILRLCQSVSKRSRDSRLSNTDTHTGESLIID